MNQRRVDLLSKAEMFIAKCDEDGLSIDETECVLAFAEAILRMDQSQGRDEAVKGMLAGLGAASIETSPLLAGVCDEAIQGVKAANRAIPVHAPEIESKSINQKLVEDALKE